MKSQASIKLPFRLSYLPWVLWVAVGTAISATILVQQASVPDEKWLFLWLLFGGVAVWFMLRTQRHVWVYHLMLGLALGGALMQERMLVWQSEVIPALWQEVSFSAKVRIDGVAVKSDQGWRVQATLIQAPSPALTHASVLLYFPEAYHPIAGEVWSTELRLQRSQGHYNPAGIDYEAWLFSQHIQAVGRVIKAEAISLEHHHWQALRWLAMEKLMLVLPSDSIFRGLSVALVLGETSGVDAQQWQVLRDTGTLHMAVVSGSHITLVAGFAWFLGLAFWKVFPTQRYPAVVVASIFSLVAAVAFAFLAGFNVPVQRALLMLLVVIIEVWLKRRFHPVLTLSWALLLVLLWDISAVNQVGFWLSFLATAMLLWLLHTSGNRLQKLLLLHVGMSVLLAPFLILFFNQIPTYSVVANLLAAPIVEWLLVPLLLIIALLAWVSPTLASYLANWADSIWSLLWQLLVTIASWPKAVILLSPFAWLHPLPAHTVQLTLLDTGTSPLVAVWQSHQGNWLIGTGNVATMEYMILPSLVALGVTELNGVLLLDRGEVAQAAVARLQRNMPVTQMINTNTCSLDATLLKTANALPFRFLQTQDGHCWLYFNESLAIQPFALTWYKPSTDVPSGIVVIAPPAEGKPLYPVVVPQWISQGKAPRHEWAKVVNSTNQLGAIDVLFTDKSVEIIRGYRQFNHRFYHQEAL